MNKDFNLNQENWKYYHGDTFDFWTGPLPPVFHPKYAKVVSHLKKIFHSYNLIKSGVKHYVNALIGKPFNWYLTNNGQKIDKNSFAEELLQKWWDWNSLNETNSSLTSSFFLDDAVTQALVEDNGSGIGHGHLRLYTPKRFAHLKQPWQKYKLHAIKPGTVVCEYDDDDFLFKASYNHKSGIEHYFLDDNNLTHIQINGEQERIVNLGGILPIFTIKGSSLITADVKQIQNSINKTLTIKDENLNTAGFLERVLLNAQLPGEWRSDPTAPGGERFVPDSSAMEFGSNKIVFVQGIPIGDPKSPTGYTSPSIQYRQPVDIGSFIGSLETDFTCFYLAIGLGHLLSAGDGRLSGVSRETIKQDWITRLQIYARIIESALAKIFTSILFLFADDLDKPELKNLTPVIQLNLAVGDPFPEQLQQIRENFAAGLISKTTAMNAIGIADVDAEMELINREKQEDIKAAIALPNMLENQNLGLDN